MVNWRLYHFLNLSDAHKQGFSAGFDNSHQPFKDPVNNYQKEYNRGHKAGLFFKKGGL